jgi:hypothetical protein
MSPASRQTCHLVKSARVLLTVRLKNQSLTNIGERSLAERFLRSESSLLL